MYLDAHQHFWQYSPDQYPWISADMARLQKDFLPPDLAPHLQAAGLDGCIAVQARQTEAETEFLIRLAQEYSIVKGVVGWVDLQAENIAERLRYFKQFAAVKGFRHVVQDEKDPLFLRRPNFVKGISYLKDYNFTYDILIFAHQLKEATAFVNHFPEQPFVLDHLAKPNIRLKEWEPWAADLKSLAQHKQVYCKISGLVTEAAWQTWKPTDFIPYLEVALEAFKPERLMLGSDWPVCLLSGEYAEVVALVKEFISRLSVTEQSDILGGNAARFYNLH